MSTDLYGARVLDVAAAEARARFRIFVVYYDVADKDQADYDVHVTDPRWLDSLEAGHSWGTTNYVSEADQVAEADAPAIVDLRAAARVLDPFPGAGTDGATPSDVAFLEVTDLPELVAEACCRLGEMAAADGDAARAAKHLERAAGTGDPAFAGRARELLGQLPRN